jgi:hypothetical protein
MIPEARRMYRFVDSIADNALPAVVGDLGVVKAEAASYLAPATRKACS